jgi:hypothetical protein
LKVNSTSATRLFTPQAAVRVRWNMYTDTPLPQEEPAGENPPDGAIIDYYLAGKASNISLEIYSNQGSTLIRRYSNMDTFYTTGALNIPLYWIRPQQMLSNEPGQHRFLWDLKYTPLNVPPSYPIGANYMNTAPDATAPWAMPGQYKVVLTVDGKKYESVMQVNMDPRVKTSTNDLARQFQLSMQCYQGRLTCMRVLDSLKQFRSMIRGQMTNPPVTVADVLGRKDDMAKKLESAPPGSSDWSYSRLNNSFAQVFSALQDSDTPPTQQEMNTLKELEIQLNLLNKRWLELRKQ